MTDWKERIEAQIVDLKDAAFLYGGDLGEELNAAVGSMQVLFDVAVAADVIMRNYDDQTTSVISWDALSYALDKLQEVSDE